MEFGVVWKGLKYEFPGGGASELKSAIRRAYQFNSRQVKSLEPFEERFNEWLDKQGVNPGVLHQKLCQRKRSSYAERYTEKRNEQKWRRILDMWR